MENGKVKIGQETRGGGAKLTTEEALIENNEVNSNSVVVQIAEEENVAEKDAITTKSSVENAEGYLVSEKDRI